jgi:hypothetical protein
MPQNQYEGEKIVEGNRAKVLVLDQTLIETVVHYGQARDEKKKIL